MPLESNSLFFNLVAFFVNILDVRLYILIIFFIIIPSIIRYLIGAIKGHFLNNGALKTYSGFSPFLTTTLTINVIALFLFLNSSWHDQFLISQISYSFGIESLYTQLHFLLFSAFSAILLFRVFYVAVEVDRGSLHGSRRLHIITFNKRSFIWRTAEVLLRIAFTLAATLVFTNVIFNGLFDIDSQSIIDSSCRSNAMTDPSGAYSYQRCVIEESAFMSPNINKELAQQNGFQNSMNYMLYLYFLMIAWNLYTWISFRTSKTVNNAGTENTDLYRWRVEFDFIIRLALAILALLSLLMMFLWFQVACPESTESNRVCSPSMDATNHSFLGIIFALSGIAIFALRSPFEYSRLIKNFLRYFSALLGSTQKKA